MEGDSPSDVTRAPLLGEHTTEILREIVGLSDEEIAQAVADGGTGKEATVS